MRSTSRRTRLITLRSEAVRNQRRTDPETAAADPALDPRYRDAARALALTYQTLVAVATGKDGGDPELEAVVTDANAKDRVMTELCGN